jgi:tetratricopeptide (TPR) repeat protein
VDKTVDRRFLKCFWFWAVVCVSTLANTQNNNLQDVISKINQSNYVQALQILLNIDVDALDSDATKGEVCLLFADCYEYFDYHDKALSYYGQSFNYFKSIKDTLGMARCLSRWGDLLEDRGEVEKAMEGFSFAEEVFSRTKDTLQLILLNNNISSAHENNRDFAKALLFLDKSFQLLSSKKDTSLLIMTFNNYGDVMRKQGKNKEAILYYQNALRLSIIIGNEDQKRAVLKDISKSYAETGQFELAYRSHVEFFDLNHRLKTKKKIDEVAQLQLSIIESQTESKLRDIEEDKETSKFRFILTIVSLVVVLTVLLILFWVYRFKTQKEKELTLAKIKLLEAEMSATKLKIQLIENELAVNKLKLEEFTQQLINKGKETKVEHERELEDDFEDNKMLKAIDELSKSHLLTNEDWNSFKEKFERVFPHFFTKLREDYPQMSMGDVRLTALMKLRLKSEEIANIMGISKDSVKKAKFRLKKKIAPNDVEFNLKTWVLEL